MSYLFIKQINDLNPYIWAQVHCNLRVFGSPRVTFKYTPSPSPPPPRGADQRGKSKKQLLERKINLSISL